MSRSDGSTCPQQVLSNTVEKDLLAFAQKNGWKRVTTVSDSNTYPLLAYRIGRALQSVAMKNSDIILNGNDLSADEGSVMSVLVDLDVETDALIAVGAGTVTDIVRFVSHRMRKAFVSVPTAPSVDGYMSSNAPLMIQGFKRSVSCHAPSLVVASPNVLAKAPNEMIVAGFGDVIGKITAIADWELAHILTDAPFDREIAAVSRSAYSQILNIAAGIASRDQEAIVTLFDALNKTGNAMRLFGASDPASGSEHHISHFLEMQRRATKSPKILHGIQVELGTLIAAQWYQILRNTSKEAVASQAIKTPDREADAAEITNILGEPGSIALGANTFVSTLNSHKVANIRTRLMKHWEKVQSIARQVPEPQDLAAILQIVGSPVDPNKVGIAPGELETAARLSHYVRNRFTVKTLLYTLGIPSDIQVKWS